MTVLPAAGPSRPVVFPAVRERMLSSGLRMLGVDWGDRPSPLRVPLVAARLVFRSGAGGDPEDRAGTAALAATVAPHGAAGMSARELARTIDALGARVDCSAGYDASTAVLGVSTARLASALGILGAVVSYPELAPGEIERARLRARSDLKLAFSSPSALARIAVARAAFASGHYARPLSGTYASLERIERADLVRYTARTYRPAGATFVVAGGISPDAAFELAEETFASWPAGDEHPDGVASHADVARGRLIIVDSPDAGRAAIILGVEAPARAAADHDAATVATAVLSGYSGRLNAEIRVRRGLSYGASAQYVARRDAGLILGSTLVEHGRVVETVDVIRETFTTLATERVGEAELERRKTSILGGYYRSIETADGVAATLADLAAYGIPADDLALHPQRIAAIDGAELERFAASALASPPFGIIVGDARRFAGELASRFARVDVVAADALDLDAPDLGATG